ncbi:MAG TPA: hypothetical protein VFK58_02955 [Sphingomicrobium sp.]|nr:hypothetical protein [Sphingomicrobium sp.]
MTDSARSAPPGDASTLDRARSALARQDALRSGRPDEGAAPRRPRPSLETADG